MKKYGLLVVDMNLRAFDPGERGGVLYREKERLASCINDLAAEFRKRGLPIFWITQRLRDDMSDAPMLQRKRGDRKYVESSEDWKLLPELNVGAGEPLIIKQKYSAFFGTDLHNQLQGVGVTSLVITGVNTYACIRQTTIDAYQYDYDPLIWPGNGIASSLPQFEQDTLKYMVGGLVESLSNAEIEARLDLD